MELHQGDCLAVMKALPSESVDLVLTDPPYNIGIAKWDKIEGYVEWSLLWLKECERLLKPNGVLYFWHNDMKQIAQLLCAIREQTDLTLKSFCIWDKGNSYRAQSWKNRRACSKTALRSWFNVCEYCLHFFKTTQPTWKDGTRTSIERIETTPNNYEALIAWAESEKDRLQLSDQAIASFYTKVTRKRPHMLKHYFRKSQFAIPSQMVWESVYMPLGFSKSYTELKECYVTLKEASRVNRNIHHVDAMHCNIWHLPPVPNKNRLHPCQKPVALLERLIRVSSDEDGTVLDCFMGSGSTGVACVNTGRAFVGIEQDEQYFAAAKARLSLSMDSGTM